MSQPKTFHPRAALRLITYSATIVVLAVVGARQPVGRAETRTPIELQRYQPSPPPAAFAASATAQEGLRTMTAVEQRLTDWFDDLNLTIKGFDERPDQPGGDVAYVVKDVFTTVDGSWTVGGEPYGIPAWAKTAYENPAILMELQKSKHLYAAVLDANGQLIAGQPVVFWSNGFANLPAPDAANTRVTQPNTGWATWTLFSPSSDYDPNTGAAGPWCWAPAGAAEVMCGGGLPGGANLSVFVVWQQVPRSEVGGGTPTEPPPTEPPPTEPPPTEPPPTEPPPTEPPPTEPPPTEPPPTEPPPAVNRRLGTWVDELGLQIKGLADRPDRPAGDTVYLIKDVFTTRDGSWEPTAVYGSIDQWAREAYLKPVGDPEYFDDAGADHHLFAAILDLEGRLVKSFPITYWSDGFAMLGDPTYAGYATQFTKEKSGWGNLVMGPSSSYVPERGEHGPWCWMPQGLPAEVMCGGGMPAKQHVSVFVVWQAVPAGGLDREDFDHTIYLPFVAH
jgi:hypothetical protein